MTAEERQRVYDRLGLRSWERAEREAEYRRSEQTRGLVEQAMTHGLPEMVGSKEDMFQWTDPRGVSRTYSPSGEQVSMTLPSWMIEPDLSPQQREDLQALHRIRHDVATGDIANYREQYSAHDQRQIERMYEARSKVATNPDLTEEERQSFFDKIDADISRVPRLTPMMQEPSPQQMFEKTIVTDPVTGARGFFDPKSMRFNPINAEINEDHRKLWWQRYDKNVTALRVANTGINVEPGKQMSDEQIMERAKTLTDMEVGSLGMTENEPVQEDEISRKYGLRRGEGFATSEGSPMRTSVSGGRVLSANAENVADMMQRFGKGAGRATGDFIGQSGQQMIKVINPKGEVGYIPEEDLEEALAKGYKLAG